MSPEADSSETESINESLPGFLEYILLPGEDALSEMLSERAIPSLKHSLRHHGIAQFSAETIRLWVADMLIEGLKESTVRRYTGALHTLYKEWCEKQGIAEDETMFAIPWKELPTEGSDRLMKETAENLAAAERLTVISVKEDSPAFVFNKAFQYLLFDPEISLKDIVGMKFSDNRPDSLHLEDLVLSMRKAPQAKYVFPLQQGKRREPAIVKDLLTELHATARRAGLKFGSSFSRESISAIWIAAAVREDISYSEIRSIFKTLPTAFSFLSMINPVEISEARRLEILNTVAYSVTNKNPGWFVLRLRSGVTPEKIKDRLKEKESPLQRQIQFYYPLRTIKKIEKKKVVTTETPVIPGILFFRLPYDRVAPLIGVIGDLAWCYRSSANPTSPYSVIPQTEMRIFQRCVGSFTEDVEMDIVSSLPQLNVGDSVMIEDGSHLDGQMATIRKVRNVDGTVTYTLRLSDTEFIKFKDVSLPASHISKVGN